MRDTSMEVLAPNGGDRCGLGEVMQPPSILPEMGQTIGSLGSNELASLWEQSVDCVKLIDTDARIRYITPNGLLAMEWDEAAARTGVKWHKMWPSEVRDKISEALDIASRGHIARFSAFRPTAKGNPRWWDVSVSGIRDEDGKIVGYLSVSRDTTSAELNRKALEISIAEMAHRLNNCYAMLGSLLHGFARGTPELETFAGEMSSRLCALAAAQTLFASRDPTPCKISELIPALMNPFERPSCTIIISDLGPHQLKREYADTVAMVFGELTVNSSKHGALAGSGSIEILAGKSEDRLEILWRERSDEKVEVHAREGGQGLMLIARIVQARQGRMELTWHPTGLDLRLNFPST